MAVLDGLKPEKVFHYFEELCGIPHGSGDTKKISDYCAEFAKKRGLRYIQDESNNIIIFQDGTEGYENSASVMLQGHLDMVCEKEDGCTIDFANDGLDLQLENGIISAKGTTLGGDDGIAVAYSLAILDSDDIPHPPLEVVFTVDEEIGMLGAAAMDCSPLKSRIMLNMDSEDEGYLLVSCAGGVQVNISLPVEREEIKGVAADLKVSGLTGGHSGVEIIKGRANSNQVLGRVLNEMRRELSYQLISVSGGLKDNAIPRDSQAQFIITEERFVKAKAIADKMNSIIQKEYSETDPNLKIKLTLKGEETASAMTDCDTKRTISMLVNLPGGVQKMSADLEGLVQTSLNMGVLKTEGNEVKASFAARSSVETEKDELVHRIENLIEVLGGSVALFGDYPGWEYNKDSKLRKLMVEVFTEQYGREPVVQALHAGVECGLFAGKLPGLDCVSFGPDMVDIHTTNEQMSVESVQRVWDYTVELLRRLK